MNHETTNHDSDQPIDVSEQTGPGEAGPKSTTRSAVSVCIRTIRSLLLITPLVVIPIVSLFLFATLVLPPPPQPGWQPHDGAYDIPGVTSFSRPQGSWRPQRERAAVVILLLLAMLALGRTGLVSSQKKDKAVYPEPVDPWILNFGRSLAVGVIAMAAATGTFVLVLVCGFLTGILRVTGRGDFGSTSAERLAWPVTAALGLILGVCVGFVLCRKLWRRKD